MLWFLINPFRSAIRKLPHGPNEIGGAVALACLMGCVGILVHSFVDFNREVQAKVAWFYVLCALAASPHAIESRQRVRRARSRSQESDLEDPAAQAAASWSPGKLRLAIFSSAPLWKFVSCFCTRAGRCLCALFAGR